MSYLGQHQLGEHIYLNCTTVNGSRTPVAPDAAPTITVFDNTGTLLLTAKKIPAVNKDRYTGVFGYNLFIGNNAHVPLAKAFVVGKYFVRYDWEISSTAGMNLDCFDVVAGGNASGAVVSMELFSQPHGDHLVMQLDSGKIVAGRNPVA